MKPKVSKSRGGRPKNADGPKVKLMTYVSADVAAAAKHRAEVEGFPSVSSWVSWVVRAALSESRDVLSALRLLGTTPEKARKQLDQIERVAKRAIKRRGSRDDD